MLPRNQRLHPRSRVRATIRRGERARNGQILVHHVADDCAPQAAVVVGKAVGPAVVRHRRQRQVRHALAQMWQELPSGSLVVRVLPGDGEYQQLSDSLRLAVGRL